MNHRMSEIGRFADAGLGVRRATVMGPASANLHMTGSNLPIPSRSGRRTPLTRTIAAMTTRSKIRRRMSLSRKRFSRFSENVEWGGTLSDRAGRTTCSRGEASLPRTASSLSECRSRRDASGSEARTQQVALRDHVIEPELVEKARLVAIRSPHHSRILPISFDQESSLAASLNPPFSTASAD